MAERDETEIEAPPAQPPSAEPPPEDLLLDRPLDPAPARRSWRDRGPLLRNILIWVLVAAAVALFWVAYQNRDSFLSRPEPIPAEFSDWGMRCGASLNDCARDVFIFKDGTHWVVDGGVDGIAMFERVSRERYETVADIITLDECPPSPYCDALFGLSRRTRIETQESVATPPDTYDGSAYFPDTGGAPLEEPLTEPATP